MPQDSLDHKYLFNRMPVQRFIVQVGDNGGYKLLEANEKAFEYFCKRQEQVMSHPLGEFLDSENVRHFCQSFEVCIRHKKPVTIQALPSFPGGLRVHGFWVSPILDEEGRIIALDVIAQPDSADKSILQRERDDAISLLTSIFDVSEVGIVVTDHNRRIIKVNDSFVRMYGWDREELLGEDFVELVTPDEREQARHNHDEFVSTGIRSSGEMKMVRRDGSVATVLFTTATLQLSQKRNFQVTTIMDISLRKQMELSLRLAKEQADAANHAKSSFLANMSHELRTPLNAIIGFSEMIKNETFGPLGHPEYRGHEKYSEYLEDIHLSARHLLEIINEVLDMSKIEAGRVELDEQKLSMSDLTDSVVRMMASKAFSSGLTIEKEIEEGLPLLYADPRLMRQILINLVTNAVKYSGQGGEILVRAYMTDDGIMRLTVSDQGVGIPKDRIVEALEPFGQIQDPVHAKAFQGTGLGLPLAKAMAELHGGTLELISDTGQGTTVHINLPARRVMYDEQSGSGRQGRTDMTGSLAHPAE